MLKVKHLTIFKQKNLKKGGNFYQGCKSNWAVSNASDFRALSLILTELWPFSPTTFEKVNLFSIFSSKWPPPQEESKCKNAQFLQWILKDDDV